MKYFFYSLPAFAFAIPTFPVMVFLPALYSEVYGLDIATIGIILFAAKLIDITTDPLMGWINDKNFFSRKVWLIIGGLLSGIALYKLFKVDEIPGNEHLLIWIVVLYTGWTIFQIPYLSIGYNLEGNYHKRTRLSASREFFVLLGLFSSLLIPIILNVDNVKLVSKLVDLAIISGFLGLLLFTIYIKDEKSNRRNNFSGINFKSIYKNNKISRLIFVWFLNTLANVFPMVLFVFYVSYILGGNDYDRQITLFYYFLFAVLGVPFWTFLSKKTNKVLAWRISLIISSLIFFFVVFLDKGDLNLFIIISCLTGLCLGADLLLPMSIQADLIDHHRMKFNEDMSGIMFSILTFLNKLSFALASIFIFGVLGLLNFDANEIVSRDSKIFIIVSYAIIPVILKIVSAFLLKNFTFGESELKKVQKIITVND
ncbi:MAG: MFS transporter [Alphaproteobacteria bacterium]